MPLSINVGLSRKSSENYQSRGVSINVVAELDATLLARPDELQQQIAGLYAQAERALDRQSQVAGPTLAHPGRPNGHESDAVQTHRYPGRDAGGGPPDRRGARNGTSGRGSAGGGPMTDNQRRAIHAIATRLGVDPHPEAHDIVGVEFAELTVRQASNLIDHLKAMEPAANGHRRNGPSR